MRRYVWELPQSEQQGIMLALVLAGVEGEDLERAMDGRVCDLEGIIDIGEWR